jgi:tetratricopeptide (TPR) repeat protein
VFDLKAHSGKSLVLTALIGLVALALFPFTLISQEMNQEITDALAVGDTILAIELIEKQIELDPSYEYNYLTLGRIYHKQEKPELAEKQFRISVEKNKKFLEGLYALCLVQLELGKVDDAEKNIQNGLKKPKDMEAYFRNGMGLVYMARGEYGKADGELRRAIVLDSTVAEFHVNLGNANFERGVYPLAIDEYEKALQLDTASLDVYFHWAEACLELKDYTCALDKLNIVLQKDSTHAEAWMRAGGIYYKAARSSRNATEAEEMYKNTIGSYKKYLELSDVEPDSTNGRAFYESGMSYLLIRGYENALENFRIVLCIPVEPKDIYFYYAWAFQGTQQYDSAIAQYEKHIEWVKEQGEDYKSGIGEVELYRRIGECYEAKKDHYKTISYYKKSLEYDSTQVRLLYGVAVAYNYIQDYRNALIYYMKRIALGADERFWSIYYNAAMSALYLAERGGQAMMEEEDFGLEDDESAVVEEVDPLKGVDLAQLAVEYLEKVTGEFWEKVMSNERNMKTAVKALNMLGSTYLYQLGECTKGVQSLERVLEVDPENCEARKSLGYAHFGGICPNNYNKALRYLQEALQCKIKEGDDRCKDVDLLLWIAQTYHFRAVDRREAKQKEEAKKDFKAAYDTYLEVLECNPGNKSATDGRDQVKFEF